jgi:hypothetical protein
MPSDEGPRLAGSERPGPRPPARWQRWPDPSIARLVVGGDAGQWPVGARLAGKARGGGLGDDRGGATPDPDRVLPPRGRHPSQGNLRRSGPTATREPGGCAATSTAANRPPSHCHHPQLCPSNCQQGHEHGHLGLFPAAVMWAMTSRDGQQLVAIAVAQPGQDPDYRRPGRDGACGLRAGRLVTAVLSGWSLGRRTEFGGRDPADAAWHVNVAGRCSPHADPGLGLASSAWLVGRAGPGRGCHPKGCQTSHQRSCPPALVWPPGQGWRPPRRPAAAFVSPASLLQPAAGP